MSHTRFFGFLTLMIALLSSARPEQSTQITAAGQPAQLDIRVAGERAIRVTLKPLTFKPDFPTTPAVVDRTYAAPVISLREVRSPVQRAIGNLRVEVRPNPLTVSVTNAAGEPGQ